MTGTSFEVDGLKELQTGLAKARRDLGKEQRRANKEVAENVAGWVRARARSGEPIERRFAAYVQPSSTQRYARLSIPKKGASNPRARGAGVAFFGARPLTRTGWNASRYDATGRRLGGRRRLPGAKPQHRPWVGNTWIPGVRGEGPYVINPTLADNAARIDDLILSAHDRALDKAFPKGG